MQHRPGVPVIPRNAIGVVTAPLLTLAVFTLALAGCFGWTPPHCDDPETIPLARLMESPDEFDGRCVRTQGYLEDLHEKDEYEQFRYFLHTGPSLDTPVIRADLPIQVEENITRLRELAGTFHYNEEFLASEPEWALFLAAHSTVDVHNTEGRIP